MADLLGLSRAEQEHAKVLLRRRLWFHLATLGVGLGSLLAEGVFLYCLAVVSLISNITAWWLRWLGSEYHAVAEGARRRAAVADALGGNADSLGTAELRAGFSRTARRDAGRWSDSAYYMATGRDHGPEVLRQVLQESSFWSARLYRTAGRRVAIRLALVLLVIVISVFLVVLVNFDEASTLAVRVATVTLTFLVGVDELGIMLGFFSAARTSDRVSRHLDSLDATSVAQLLTVYADYSVATAAAAPIPTRIYLSRREAIEEAWTLAQRSIKE